MYHIRQARPSNLHPPTIEWHLLPLLPTGFPTLYRPSLPVLWVHRPRKLRRDGYGEGRRKLGCRCHLGVDALPPCFLLSLEDAARDEGDQHGDDDTHGDNGRKGPGGEPGDFFWRLVNVGVGFVEGGLGFGVVGFECGCAYFVGGEDHFGDSVKFLGMKMVVCVQGCGFHRDRIQVLW